MRADKQTMENMRYAEELVREYLVFRGFTNTLQSFDKELSTDIGKSFHVDKIFDLIFSDYIPKFRAQDLVNLLTFFKNCFVSSETSLISALLKLDVSVLRYYIVYAIQAGKKDKVTEFFDCYGANLLINDQAWLSWFAIPYVKNPELDPKFRLYFSKEWLNGVHIFVRNFLSNLLSGTRIPALLKISSESNTVNNLKEDIKQLNLKLSELQALLEEKESDLSRLRSNASLVVEEGFTGTSSSTHSAAHTVEQSTSSHGLSRKSYMSATPPLGQRESSQDADETKLVEDPQSVVNNQAGISERSYLSEDTANEMQREDEFPEVKVQFQETFLGHTSPISRCRFSASGDNIASASVDGTVRIWTYNSSAPASRNATIYSGAEIMSLEWDSKSDRLLLIGTADGGIKAWNADAKRVVCDLFSTKEFPSILDIKCSPVEPIFVSAAATRGKGTSYTDKYEFASLTVWNMRTWKAMTVLPLGEDPPAIASLCFNHNGKLLAAGATDGMIHIFDMSAGMQITGWPAHDSAICSVLFGSDETSIFSLGMDGKMYEWSLHNQGKVLWSQDCSRFCNPQTALNLRHEMALDASGRSLLLTSNSVRAPIYKVHEHTNRMRTLPHSAAVTTVDWHPALPIFLTGSADHSVRVTYML